LLKTLDFHTIRANELSPVVILVLGPLVRLPTMSTSLSFRRRRALSSASALHSAPFKIAISFGLVLLACAPQLRAQSDDSQQSTQDVAEAARQARARKQQTAAQRHVYTNEDLRRGKILTREDQARAAAANHKNSAAPAPAATPDAQPLDANATTPQETLGDVARRYRNAKKTSPFHLPLNSPELAIPKFVAPLAALNSNLQPSAPPKNFNSGRPALPLSQPAAPSAPSLPSSRTNRINPFVGRRSQPVPPTVAIIRPVEPRSVPQPNFAAIPMQRSMRTVTPPHIVVQPGDTLWALSRHHLGRGTRWLELMAANPDLNDPTRLVPGTQLTLPSRTSTRPRAAQTVTIQTGDSLSKIALAAYGHASAWPCIAQANSSLTNPHQLRVGQSIALPASCTP
jgi:nucleoid-associated protein YgaU